MKTENTNYKKISNLIISGKIYEAVEMLEKIARESELNIFGDELNSVKEIYDNLLEYNFKGINDPERDEIYLRLQKKLLSINDNINYTQQLTTGSGLFIYEKRKYLNLIKNKGFTIQAQIKNIIDTVFESENVQRKYSLNELFNTIWTIDTISPDEAVLLNKTVAGKKLFLHEKALIVSAVTISLLFRFDIQKFFALLNFADSTNKQVRNRAFVGLILASYTYNDRLILYKDFLNRAEILSDRTDTQRLLKDIIFQLIRTKETRKISDRLKNEIMPEMAKLHPKIEEKLNLDQIISDSLIEDKNPDWEEVFEDSPDLIGKMEEISKMQLEGSDVFMTAFATLKHFPFFNNPANWFLLFYKENQEATSVFDQNNKNFDAKVFLDGLERTAYICNSDKYSFCLNVKYMPETQKKMIVDLFKIEVEQMNEISSEDQILNKNIKDKHIFTTYIQDLYRFFKLHPWQKDFPEIFEQELDIHNTILYKLIIKNTKLTAETADFYFEKNYWNEAVKIYTKLELKGKEATKIYEKIGFAYQRMFDYQNALKYYQIAELYGEPSIWLTKKIAFCFRKNKEFDKALEYYQKIESEQPENLHIQANIGHCRLSTENFEQALKHYYKVEYYDPENISVMRPLAWCSFMTDKYKSAEKYYKKLIEKNPTRFDYINYAHLLLCTQKKTEAVSFYLKAAKISGAEKFEQIISDDAKYLIKKGISKSEILLLTDYIKSKLKL